MHSRCFADQEDFKQEILYLQPQPDEEPADAAPHEDPEVAADGRASPPPVQGHQALGEAPSPGQAARMMAIESAAEQEQRSANEDEVMASADNEVMASAVLGIRGFSDISSFVGLWWCDIAWGEGGLGCLISNFHFQEQEQSSANEDEEMQSADDGAESESEASEGAGSVIYDDINEVGGELGGDGETAAPPSCEQPSNNDGRAGDSSSDVDSSTDSRAPDDAGAPPIAQPDNEWTQQSVIEKATSSSPPRAALNAANVAKHNQQIELVSRGVLCYPHLSTLITYSLFGLNVLHISAAPTPPPLNPPR